MIESVEFSQGILSLAVTDSVTPGPFKGQCRVQFDFSEGGAVTEFHSSKLMDLIEAVNPKCAGQVRNLTLELFRTHPGIRGIDFNLLYGSSENLEGSAPPDVQVQLASGAIESAGSEKDVSLSLG